jgi:hypothetical protein
MKTTLFALLMILLVAAVSAKDLVVSSPLSETMDVEVAFNGALTEMTGSVLQNDMPVSGATFTFFCQDYNVIETLNGPVESYVTLTDLNGEFDYLVTEQLCEYGDDAWVVVTLNDVDYTSEKFTITKEGSNSFSSQSLTAASVPEFGFETLGITMIGAGLIFAFLRKR